MNPGIASFTAEGSAFARAVGARHPDPKLRNPDWMAEWMLGPTFRRRAFPGISRISQRVMEYLAPGAFFGHQARTKYFDALVRKAIRDGIRQFVLLGAGLDTRAYRFADLLEGIAVFEVDHPATSSVKRQRVAQSLGEPPPNVRYVAVDFSNEVLRDRLGGAGFQGGARTFFLWEGVSPYLDRAAVDELLNFIRASGSRISFAFDYLFADAIAHPENWSGMARQMRTVANRGEPYKFGVDPSDVATFLSSRGLTLDENVLPADCERRYLIGSDGKLWGHVPSFFGMALARRG